MSSVDTNIVRRIEEAVRELAEQDYPLVWVGEEGMTPEDILLFQEQNEHAPEWLRCEPGDERSVENDPEAPAGVTVCRIPGASYRYLYADWVLENVPLDDPPEVLLGELDEARLVHEVMYHRAAERGEVPVVLYDSWDAMADGNGQLISIVPVEQLSRVFTSEVLKGVLKALEFFLVGSCEPYVIPTSEWAEQAVEDRLWGVQE